MMRFLGKQIRTLLSSRLARRCFSFMVRQAREWDQSCQVNSLHSRLKVLGEGSDFKGEIVVTCPAMTTIESNVHVGDNAFFFSDGGLYIGQNTHISRNVSIYTANHDLEGKRLPYDEKYIDRPVLIGRNVWIGMNVSICPGSRIGDGAIIGMGSVVAGEVPPGAVYVGAKGRLVGSRDEEHYRTLDAARAYGGHAGASVVVDDSYSDSVLGQGTPPVFVLSAGRSGSQSIAKTLSQHSSLVGVHEPHPQLMRLSADYAYGLVDDEAAFEELRFIYRNTRRFHGSVYCESDQNLFNLAELLTRLSGESRFLHLVRDGREFVASAVHRGWFSERDLNDCLYADPFDSRWSWHRLRGDRCGDISSTEWNGMPPFAKACWYWSYVNDRIDRFGESEAAERFLRVSLNNLDAELANIHEFFGVAPEQVKPIHSNQARGGKPAAYATWDAEQHQLFEHYCGTAMDKFFPAWRCQVETVQT